MKNILFTFLLILASCEKPEIKPNPQPEVKQYAWTIYTKDQDLTCNWYRGSTIATWKIYKGETDTLYTTGPLRVICSCETKGYILAKKQDSVYYEGVTNTLDIRY